MLLNIDPTKKHILLLKLVDYYENAPSFDEDGLKPMSSLRGWLASVGAILKSLGTAHDVRHTSNMRMLLLYKQATWDSILCHTGEAIEELRLDLELDGRSEIGSVYEPGDVYRFYADVKNILSSAHANITIVDPYFNGETFDAYFGSLPDCDKTGLGINILTNKYINDLKQYTDRFSRNFTAPVEVRKSKELHDRLIILDTGDCWIIGSSIKDAGKKTTYLIPLQPDLAAQKIEIYNHIWEQASEC